VPVARTGADAGLLDVCPMSAEDSAATITMDASIRARMSISSACW
jgi:hypothetical protein